MSDQMAPASVTADRRPRTSWGWFVALGILMILLGAFAWYDIIGLARRCWSAACSKSCKRSWTVAGAGSCCRCWPAFSTASADS